MTTTTIKDVLFQHPIPWTSYASFYRLVKEDALQFELQQRCSIVRKEFSSRVGRALISLIKHGDPFFLSSFDA